MHYQQATKSAQKEGSKTPPSSSPHQTSLNRVAVHPLLELQRTIGNQAVLNLLRSSSLSERRQTAVFSPTFGPRGWHTKPSYAPPGGRNGADNQCSAPYFCSLRQTARNVQIDTTTHTFVEPRFSHDFSRIPIHSPAAGAIQTKLAINQPGDECEQEADRISEQVMRMPELQLQRACACGGACPECQTEKLAQEHERLQTKHIGSGDLGQTAVPPIVDEVLAAPGQPLDPAARAFMEPRFGHDFSRVRVHTDPLAARSAEAVAAQAYTVGSNVVFGMGRYAPASRDGQRLLAHELAHVVQQNTSYSMPAIVQRSPDNKPVDPGIGVPEVLLLGSTNVWPKDLDYHQELLMLAANPDHAHDRWKGLTTEAKFEVAGNMARFYGATFATQFVHIHEAAKVPEPDLLLVYSDTTPTQLTARGFHFAGEQVQESVALQMRVEIWFHPSGTRLKRLIHQPESKPEEPPEDCIAQAEALSSLLKDIVSSEKVPFQRKAHPA